MSLPLWITLFVQILQVSADFHSYPEIRVGLQRYQDLGTCLLDQTEWNLVYRNFYDDPHFGTVQCATFTDLGLFKDYFATKHSNSSGILNSSKKIVLSSSPSYIAKNIIRSRHKIADGILKVHVIYRDCQKCIVLRHPYANNGYGCTYWRRFDTIKEQADGCEFIYDELCGTSPKYQSYNATCTPEAFDIVPWIPANRWVWLLLRQRRIPLKKPLLPLVSLTRKDRTGWFKRL